VPPGTTPTAAQLVARHRLNTDRLDAPFGDPRSDELLARDVIGRDTELDPAGASYVAVRTAFFDRVVVDAVERGVTQIVSVMPGMDGRSLRYSNPGVRWFELDRSDVLAEKRDRMDRLGIGACAAVAVPLAEGIGAGAVDDLARTLRAAGHRPAEPSLLLCEDVVTVLDPDGRSQLLSQLHRVAAPRSRLALSLSVSASAVCNDRRDAFRAAVESLAGPGASTWTAEEAAEVFVSSGWAVVESTRDDSRRQRAHHAGLVLLQPEWSGELD
jgi:methyltransferase (TIGR00027 family)